MTDQETIESKDFVSYLLAHHAIEHKRFTDNLISSYKKSQNNIEKFYHVKLFQKYNQPSFFVITLALTSKQNNQETIYKIYVKDDETECYIYRVKANSDKIIIETTLFNALMYTSLKSYLVHREEKYADILGMTKEKALYILRWAGEKLHENIFSHNENVHETVFQYLKAFLNKCQYSEFADRHMFLNMLNNFSPDTEYNKDDVINYKGEQYKACCDNNQLNNDEQKHACKNDSCCSCCCYDGDYDDDDYDDDEYDEGQALCCCCGEHEDECCCDDDEDWDDYEEEICPDCDELESECTCGWYYNNCRYKDDIPKFDIESIKPDLRKEVTAPLERYNIAIEEREYKSVYDVILRLQDDYSPSITCYKTYKFTYRYENGKYCLDSISQEKVVTPK